MLFYILWQVHLVLQAVTSTSLLLQGSARKETDVSVQRIILNSGEKFFFSIYFFQKLRFPRKKKTGSH